MGPPAAGLDFRDHLPAAVGVAAMDDDFRSGPGELACDHSPDAVGRARDKREFTGEIFHTQLRYLSGLDGAFAPTANSRGSSRAAPILLGAGQG